MTLKPSAEFLSQIALVAGLLTAAPSLFALAAPAAAAKAFKAFPRSVWPGRVLAAFCIAWAALWLIVMPFFPIIREMRDIMWIIVPLFIAAVWFFIPELLSCRAFGLLLVLVPSPMLSAAQWHPSAFRYVVIVYAYVLAITGMFYIALPYIMRDHITWAFANPKRARAVAAAFAALGVVIAALSFTVF